ncbi:unnamed protein product [Thelazia callipaeda]|uniref:MBD domain-containing protein n=1 Tax=Thelazia callipaeda TaxID=103827 RepID=A0A158RBE2_THECL|nr:unnamed protein product [Thelazia callipaeda]
MSKNSLGNDSTTIHINTNAFLVDETSSSDSSDEIAVFDSRDLSLLSYERKVLCEERICDLYKAFRFNGPEYKSKRTVYGSATLDTDFFDHIQQKVSLNFDARKISQALNLYHIKGVGIRVGASRMRISVFDFIVLLMDHIWKERNRTVKNYSIYRVAGYVGVDRSHLLLLSNLVNSNFVLSPSEIAVKTLCEPTEMIVMLTMVLAQMYSWPVAKDFNKKWKNIETASIPSDEEAVQSLNDLTTIALEVLESFKNDRPSSYLIHLWLTYGSVIHSAMNGSNDTDLITMSNELTEYTSSLLNELIIVCLMNSKFMQLNVIIKPWDRRTLHLFYVVVQRALPLASESIPEVCSLTPKWSHWAESLINQQSSSNSEKNEDTFGEEISVVTITKGETSLNNYVIVDDPVDISDIPNGSFCLARQQKAYNFVRCQIIKRASSREYCVLFGDGNEEVVDISRIARKIEGRLRMWEGVRVCALYEPKLASERYRKAFYSGIVGVGPHGFSQNEMLIFFDNGVDSFVHERTVYMLAEQKSKLNGGKEEIDRRNNWCLVPQSRQRFMHHYLKNFPDWPLVPMRRKENTQRVNILRDGKAQSAFVLRIDRQFALLRFPNRQKSGADCVALPCNRHSHLDEWIYRGSERLEAIRQTIDRLEKIERQEKVGVGMPLTRSRREARLPHNLEYTLPLLRRHISNVDSCENMDLCQRGRVLLGDNESIYPRRQTARKGGNTTLQKEIDFQDDSVLEGKANRPRKEKNLIVHTIPEWSGLRQSAHSQCTIDCLQRLDKDPYDKDFSGYSPYMIPMLVGWSREIATFTRKTKLAHNHKVAGSTIVYRTPCGIPTYRLDQITKYLKDTCSRLTIDLFTFDRRIRPNVVYQTPRRKRILDDITNGYEAVPISVSNEIDDDKPPQIEYDPRRYPYDKNTDISSISMDFCCGCTCTDDCADESRCECRLLTRAEVLRLDKSLQPSSAIGYMFRNLALSGSDESYMSGLYECNEKCGCSRSSCHNRVVQQQIKFPLELFKTEKMGWGVRSLVDIPEGVFVCTYAGAFGDEYFADINLVDNVEKEKHNAGVDLEDPNDGYYSDDEIQGREQNLSETGSELEYEDVSDEDGNYDSGQDSSFSSEESHGAMQNIKVQKFRGREQEKISFIGGNEEIGPPKGRFDMVKYIENMGFPSLYTIDAKKKGNIGRFFNHSCQPNIRSQLVYVDTHDFRLPWIAFFTTTKVSAGSELFWDYGYSEGTVDGKQLECFCGSRFCRKRLL